MTNRELVDQLKKQLQLPNDAQVARAAGITPHTLCRFIKRDAVTTPTALLQLALQHGVKPK